MNIRRILITSDDGYNSIGVKLLVSILKDSYDLSIAGTVDQQSGVGGHINIKGKWGIKKVCGINALWVDGYPVNAVECAKQYFRKPFDVVISGVNWGLNVGYCFVTSGTLAAATRSFGIGLTNRAIAFSWQVPFDKWNKKISYGFEKYLAYPGASIDKLIKLAFSNDFWGAKYLNINLPSNISDTALFTKIQLNHNRFYHHPVLDRKKNIYYYPHKLASNPEKNISYDTGAIMSGYISITPYDITPENQIISNKKTGYKIKL